MKMRIRNIMIGFCVFVGTCIIGIAAYRAGDMADDKTNAVTEDIVSTEKAEKKDDTEADYYIARIEENVLVVYASRDGKDEFMYTLDVRIEDIAADEIGWLEEGVVLDDRQSLASFEEDFTS